MAYSFDWVDAFTTQPFSGNGCVVVYGADSLAIPDRLALVKETSLAECAYLVQSDLADFGARFYLADAEIPMAGHPTLATVASLVDRGLIDMSTGRASFTLEVGAGVLPIEVHAGAPGPVITMTQMPPQFGALHDPADIAALYGLSVDEIVGQPQTVSTGTAFCITVLKDQDALGRAQLNVGLLAAFRAKNPGVMEPFLVTLGGMTPAGDTFSRLLLAPPSLPEDPFTGSATGCMGAYLWHHGLLEQPKFVAEQGHWLGRPGRGTVEVLGARDAISGVKLGGQGCILMRGYLNI